MESSKARCAYSSPSDSGGKASPGCVATQGEVLRTQRRVLSQLFSGWVMVPPPTHGLRVQPDSVLLCGNAVSEKSEALEILDHCVRSGPAAEVLQGAQGAVVAERRRRQGDDDPGRLVQKWRRDGRHALGRYSRR